MKKYLFTILAMATVLVACETEGPIEPVDPIETPEVAVSLSGSVPGLTRVSSDNAGVYKFQENDEITVITDNNTMRNFTAAQGAGETASFEGTIPQGESIVAAFYPASEYHTSSTFNVPTNILWKQDASNMPMYATVVTTQEEGKYNAEFKAVGGVLKLVCFNIPENATKMVFTAATQKIAGEFTITEDNNGNDQIVGSTSEVDNSITFDFSGNRSDNMVFYVPLPVVTLTGGFTIAFKNDTEELFSKTSPKAAVITRNKLLIAPALNCGTPAADATLTNSEMQHDLPTSAYGDGTITSTSGTWTFTNARYIVNKMQIKKIADGGFLQLPSFGSSLSSITLYGVNNGGGSAYSGTVSLDANTTTTDNALASKSVSNVDEGSIEISIPDSVKTKTGYLYSDGVIRFTSIIVKFRDCDAPSISSGTDVITINAGSKVATTSVILYNPIDDLGVSAILNDAAIEWVESAELSEGILTITAKSINSTQDDFTGTLTLKATGAAYKTLNLVQKSAVVPNPEDLVAIAGNESMTATWTKNEHAESYVAYLHNAQTETPAEGGEALTPTLSGGTYTVTKDGLTNDQEYWLYVKVNEVEDSFFVPTEYVSTTFTPAAQKGTLENPYSVTEAIANTPSSGTSDNVYIHGIVSQFYNTSIVGDGNNYRYYISDDGTTSSQLLVYKGKGLNNVAFSSADDLTIGDEITILGGLTTYNNTKEVAANNYIISRKKKLAAPTFTPEAGTYYSAQNVEISAAEGATIYYTTDETDPTTESTLYTAPIAVAENMTIKAIAVKEDFVTSAVAEAEYVIAAATKLNAPVINVDSFNHNSITFSWAAVENATGYQVSTNGGTDWSDTQVELTYTWTGLYAETEYTIYVKAIGTTSGQYSDSDAASKSQTTAAPKTLVSITLTKAPTTTTYNVNETFSLAGAVVTATYSDESTADVTASCTTEYDFSTTGNKTVTISYTEGDITRTCDCNVTVAIVDVLTSAWAGTTSGSSYADWSGKAGSASDAVYAGNSNRGVDYIQIRTSNSNSGIVSTTSGGLVKKVSVVWETQSTSGKTIDIYGKNTAYTSPSDLFNNSNQGTKIGSIVSGTSTELSISGEYQYIGIRSNSGAVYLEEIRIEWGEASSVATPTFSVAGGTYEEAKSVELSCATEGATIYYTTDGSTPNSSSTQYTSAINVDASMTLKAIAIKGSDESSVASATYTLKVKAPTFSPTGGSYTEAQSVEISCATNGATIYYTTDGTTPTGNSTQYSSAIPVSVTTTIRAIAIKAGWSNSDVAPATFTIGGGEPKTSSLVFTAACGGSGTADDGVEWTVTSDGSESSFDSQNGKGIHYGTSSAQVQYIRLSTSDITGTITKVVVNASTASGVSATVSVTVGGDAFGGDPKSLTTSAANYTFEDSASGEIVVTVTKPSKATKALYVKSIIVTYN